MNTTETKSRIIQTETGEWVFRVVPGDTTFQRRYETAAWYTTVEVQPGDYPVRFHDKGKPASPETAMFFGVEMPAVITYDYCPTLYGGVAINDTGCGPVDPPMPTTYYRSGYWMGGRLANR